MAVGFGMVGFGITQIPSVGFSYVSPLDRAFKRTDLLTTLRTVAIRLVSGSGCRLLRNDCYRAWSGDTSMTLPSPIVLNLCQVSFAWAYFAAD